MTATHQATRRLGPWRTGPVQESGGGETVHMLLTTPLIYPPGTRIITLSRKPPLPFVVSA